MSGSINERLLDELHSLSEITKHEIARLMLENVRYLEQHSPADREMRERFHCSGRTYHVPPCGNYEAEGDCLGVQAPWCDVAGHDCPDCALVAELELLLVAEKPIRVRVSRRIPEPPHALEDPYKPGDVIAKEGKRVQTRRYTVADPARTTHGKLRLISESGSIITTWWGAGSNPEWLPPHYRHLPGTEE